MSKIKHEEEQEQAALVEYLQILQDEGKDITFTHVPHSTYTKSWAIKLKNKRLGVRAGFPDLVIIVNRQLVIIEMKRKKNGRVTPEQKVWIEKLSQAGVSVHVCNGFDEAIYIINLYLFNK